MKRFWLLNLSIIVLLLVLFGIAEGLGVPLLSDPEPFLEQRGLSAGVIGIALLIVDVVLPVPSSFVMIAFGVYYGFWTGTALSLIGGTGAACVGFAIGRAGGPLMDRLLSPAERQRANALLDRHGATAIIATRPLPLLAETTAIVAGTSRITWRRFVPAAFLGSIPAAALYAAAGATASGMDHAVAISGAAIALALLYGWLLKRRQQGCGD